MICYHTTTVGKAKFILRDGFSNMGASRKWPGVWVSPVPFRGVMMITLEIHLPNQLFEKHEVRNRGRREANIPAEVLNQYGRVLLYDENDRPMVELSDEELRRQHLL